MAARNLHFPPLLLHADDAKSLKAELQEVAARPGRSPLAMRILSDAIDRASHDIDTRTAREKRRDFHLSYSRENSRVLEWLMLHSSRPQVAGWLWGILLDHMSPDPEQDGEVLMDRDAMVARMVRPDGRSVSGRSVDAVLSELVSINALTRKREAVPGLRGRGRVRYFVSARVATRKARDAARVAYDAAPPLSLRVVGGTDVPSERRSRAPVSFLPVL